MEGADRGPRLIVFAGLPGAGKSAVADRVAKQLGIPVLSVDPIEEGMHRAGIGASGQRGRAAYDVAARVAEHILTLGQRVIIEAANAEPEGRAVWHDLGRRCGITPAFVEVACSDLEVHRRRLEGREPGYPGVEEPAWATVEARRAGYDGWDEERLVLDSMDGLAANVDRTLAWCRAEAG
ncbi:MAG: AAA family ATPase [Iamia sp.]